MTSENETQRPSVWVVTPCDRGMDGMAPERLYGDDIGPFPTREQAQDKRDELMEAAYEAKDFYARWTVRQVGKQVIRWE